VRNYGCAMTTTNWRAERDRIIDTLIGADLDDGGLLGQITAVTIAARDLRVLRINLQLDALKLYPAAVVARATGVSPQAIRKIRSVKSA
jgi:hypothetical protein